MYLKPGTQGKYKFNPRWEKGIWLGVRDETAEIIIGTDSGAVKARDFKRIADKQERWSKEAVLGMKGTPWEPTPGIKMIPSPFTSSCLRRRDHQRRSQAT